METFVFLIYLFVGVGLITMIRHCIVWRRFEQGLLSNNEVIVVEMGMSKDDIEKLPHFAFKKKKVVKGDQVDCAICLEIFDVGEKCRLLPSCGHSFHAECVDLWLLKSLFCPVCRAKADVSLKV